MSACLRIPVATCRFQFNRDFRFEDACNLVPYLGRLGISDVYASPVLQAVKGSLHGYDVTDPTRLDPELGTERDFDALTGALNQLDMGLLLDIVPNHMAASPENPWWRDVTKKGRDSPFARFFDLNWLDFKGEENTVENYRRFFDIGGMVGVRVEDPDVFDATHSYVIRLVDEGKVTGLRVDHIDGLYDPLEYLVRLQRSISKSAGDQDFYLLVEKILTGDETLPSAWPVHGTTGYDFAVMLNNLFVDSDGFKILRGIYSQVIGSDMSFHDLVYEKKKLVMADLFPAEIEGLGRYLACLSKGPGAEEAMQAVTELTACLPVYRTYIRNMEAGAGDRKYIEIAAREAVKRGACPEAALDFLRHVLLADLPGGIPPEEKTRRLDFTLRWQQFTGAVMAKGFEDTALYNYNCLVSLNEVGGNPDTPGLSIRDFHDRASTRLRYRPHALNATSTHDTKRSEDVRARINVLSEIPGEWEEHLNKWREWNAGKKHKSGGLEYPEANTEILLYQTLIGAWPLHHSEEPEFRERLKAYMIKAVREAKVITGWLKINQEYEEALLAFIDAILEDPADNMFLRDFREFQDRITCYGAWNSLSQVLLKITLPGVPDFYQGTELWDFSLVDPDNRRPVNYKARQEILDSFIDTGESRQLIQDMMRSWQDGRIKLYITYKALELRNNNREPFQKGDYIPLRVEGDRREHVCAFIRRSGGQWTLAAAPRFMTGLSEAGVPPVGKRTWREDRIVLPGDAPVRWRNVFTGELLESSGCLPLAGVFGVSPVALLVPPV